MEQELCNIYDPDLKNEPADTFFESQLAAVDDLEMLVGGKRYIVANESGKPHLFQHDIHASNSEFRGFPKDRNAKLTPPVSCVRVYRDRETAFDTHWVQLLGNVDEALLGCFEREIGVALQAEGQVVRSKCYVVYSWTICQSSRIFYGLDRLELDHEDSVVVPPLCIR